MRRITMLSGLVLVGGLLGPATATAAEGGGDADDQHRWIAVEDEFAIVLPNGDTFTDEDPPPDEESEPPTGARIFLGEALYTTDDGETPGDEAGRNTIVCTVPAITTSIFCDIVFDVDGAGQLYGTAFVDFTDESGTEPLQFDIAVTGGTGDFSGARGVVTLTDITDLDDPEAATTTLYETDIDVRAG
jgi:hypothetical protein